MAGPAPVGWPADQVERWPIAKLIPYARNARTHSDAQIAQLAAAIREWGWTMPVLVDPEGTIIAGHGRVLAARQLAINEVPVMVARDWTDAQKKAYGLADNQLALKAGWDADMLRVEIADLQGLGFDLAIAGFEPVDIDALLHGGGSASSASGAGSLADRFGIPPFSVLNAREGWWQDRKAAWIALGIQSEIGRGENLLRFSDTVNETHAGRNPNRHRRGEAAP